MGLWLITALLGAFAATFARNWGARVAFLVASALAVYLICGRIAYLRSESEGCYILEVYLAPLLVLIVGTAGGLALLSERDSRQS